MNPILINFGNIQIYSYPLLMGIAWGLSYNLIKRNLIVNKLGLKGFNTVYWLTFIFAWIGSKVFFLLHSAGDQVELYMESSNFWLGGGFVFYGGFLFAACFLVVWTKLFKKYEFENLKYFIPVAPLSHAIGRVGCLLAGCCFGTTCDLPWAIYLHKEYRHPVQLYEAIGLTIISFILFRSIKNKNTNYIISFYLISYSLLRYVLEFFRGDKIRGLYTFGSTSQIVSLSLILIVLIVNFLQKKKKNI